MNNNINTDITPGNGKAIAGVILMLIGGTLLADQFDLFFIPDWLFSWPMWMIAWGAYMGAKSDWKKPAWIIITLIGVACLADQHIPDADRIVWPVVLISFGAWLVLKPRKQKETYYFGEKKEPFHFDKTAEPEV
ncbi:MAG TPA: DUF5668 domain-containing protein [Mucilaginibacter sp.]